MTIIYIHTQYYIPKLELGIMENDRTRSHSQERKDFCWLSKEYSQERISQKCQTAVFPNHSQTSKIFEVFVKFNSARLRWNSAISMAT